MRKSHSEIERDAARVSLAIIGFIVVAAVVGLGLAGWILFDSLGGT